MNYNSEIDKILTMEGNQTRWQKFVELVESNKPMTKEEFCDGLNYAYTTGIVDDSLQAGVYFERATLVGMLQSERGATVKFEKLPDQLTIYRGASISEKEDELELGLEDYNRAFAYGLSWTYNRRMADFFAYRHTTENRAVYRTVIDKNSIGALFLCRCECEVVVTELPNVVEVISQNGFNQYGHKVHCPIASRIPKIITNRIPKAKHQAKPPWKRCEYQVLTVQ